MSRSYRRPYSAVCGKGSASPDKTLARRGVRRKQNLWLRIVQNLDLDSALAPHKFECHWNNTYSWSRDGGKWLHEPSARDWNEYCKFLAGPEQVSTWEWKHLKEYNSVWPPAWYQGLTRK